MTLPNPVRRELLDIKVQTVEAVPEDTVLVVNFGVPAGLRAPLGGALYTGPSAAAAVHLIGTDRPRPAAGFALARMAKAAGLVTW